MQTAKKPTGVRLSRHMWGIRKRRTRVVVLVVVIALFAAGGVIFHQPRRALLFGIALAVSGALLLAGLLREKS